HSLIEIGRERVHRPAELVAGGREAKLNGLLLHSLLKGTRVEVARALVEQGGEHGGDRRLPGRVGIAATLERIVERDDRHRRFAHQPRLDPTGRCDRLDLAGGIGCREAGETERKAKRKRNNPVQDFFSSRAAASLTRYPVTERRLSR